MPHRRPSLVKKLYARRFGALTVQRQGPRSKRGYVQWLCRCDCGERLYVESGRLLAGQKQTCGRNGHYPKRKVRSGFLAAYRYEYGVWGQIKQRCHNKYDRRFANYGAKGIELYPEWRNNFERFLMDVGQRPSPKHLLKRIDETLSFVPGNVEWRLP